MNSNTGANHMKQQLQRQARERAAKIKQLHSQFREHTNDYINEATRKLGHDLRNMQKVKPWNSQSSYWYY